MNYMVYSFSKRKPDESKLIINACVFVIIGVFAFAIDRVITQANKNAWEFIF